MDHDQVMAELDAQYQELLQSVQLEGVGPDERSESAEISVRSVSNSNLENVSGIILKYQQTLQTSRGTDHVTDHEDIHFLCFQFEMVCPFLICRHLYILRGLRGGDP